MVISRLLTPNGIWTMPTGMPIKRRTARTSMAKKTLPASERASQRSARRSLPVSTEHLFALSDPRQTSSSGSSWP